MSERIYVMEGADLEGEDAVGVRVDGDWTHVRIGERTHSFERLVLQDGGNALRLEDGRIVRVDCSGDFPNVRVSVNGAHLDLRVRPERDTWLKSAGGRMGGGDGTLSVSMPGRVVKILAADGDSVEAGAGVLIVEAMKMENEVKAPFAGIVRDIRVEEGDSVEAEQLLARVEAVEEAA